MREKPANFLQYRFTGENVDVVQRDDRLDARYCLFQQLATAEQGNQLLRVFTAAERPKTSPAASSHDYGVGVFEHGICSHVYNSKTTCSICSGETLRAASGRLKSSARLGT